jgi:hypothetical protein
MHRIVLVHGGFVDGSGWAGVYQLLATPRFQRRGIRLEVATIGWNAIEAVVAIAGGGGDSSRAARTA